MPRTTTRTQAGIDRRAAAGVMSIWMILMLLLTAIVPAATTVQAATFPGKGIQFGDPIDRNTCASLVNDEIQKILNDLGDPRWVRINLINADHTTAPCDPAATYQQIISSLKTGTQIKVIGLLSNDFIYTQGETAQEFAQKAGALAQRSEYSGVDVWEIWNEPDLPATGLSHATYADMLMYTRDAMPGETIITGGVQSGGVTYLNGVIAALAEPARNRTLAGVVDGIGLNAYTKVGYDAGPEEGINDRIYAFKDFGLNIYITEFGWGYAGNGGTQCNYLVDAYNHIQNQTYAQVVAAVWFKLEEYQEGDTNWGLYTGADAGMTPRPAATAYRDLSKAGCPAIEPTPTPCPGMTNGAGTTDATINQFCPVPPRVIQAAAGDRHSCALMDTGIVKCWGQNTYGQLGDGTTTNRSTPTQVPGLSGVTAIATGGDHSCAVLNTGSLQCWGRNFSGQLGDGTTTNRSTPITVPGVSGATAVGASYFRTCVIITGGAVKCWGNGSSTPSTVSGLSGATAIGVGALHSCAILNTGIAKCWGQNSYGQLGNGTTTGSTTPVTVSGLSSVVSIAGGYYHSCAVLSTGSAVCWGSNDKGQLGDGTLVNRTTPVNVLNVSGATTIDSTAYHTCATQSDGVAKCWGINLQGQLGDGTTTNRSTPVSVTGLNGSPAVTPGRYHTCARTFLGGMKCWGTNWEGQLGDGTMTSRLTPVDVIGLN